MSVPRKRGKVKKKRSAVAKRPSKKSRRVSDNTKPRVSKKKPKPRRKRKLSPAIRSQAAIKGWETRRKNQLRRQAQTSTEAHLAFLRQPQVAAQITEQLIRTNLVRPGMIQSVETQMLSRLIVAEQLGNFDATARELANEFSWDIRDVYTLWHSP
jgi:hypothetical protein